jgi:hypothetical protein
MAIKLEKILSQVSSAKNIRAHLNMLDAGRLCLQTLRLRCEAGCKSSAPLGMLTAGSIVTWEDLLQGCRVFLQAPHIAKQL